MEIDSALREKISAASKDTPDPAMAEADLLRLFDAAASEGHAARLVWDMADVALLFASSRFLANHSIANPGDLARALDEAKAPMTREALMEEAGALLPPGWPPGAEEAMRALRAFKKRRLIAITMRYLKGDVDVAASMEELTLLAEATLEAALGAATAITERRYGPLKGGARMAVIGLGKLGGMELNYSSDIDLMFVYGGRGGKTEGAAGPAGIRVNRIGAHEFYAKVVESVVRLLSAGTADGVAYRVDLRLRPQGQRGELAMGLPEYRSYYRSWGRTWERMALIRARPVAGDRALGEAFMSAVEPFVWGVPVDYPELEEIKALKRRIDSSFLGDDIKRGYGGIREAEFFVQSFQLIYGPGHATLRTYRLLNALQGLRWLGLLPEGDVAALWESYLFLRRVEHHLQMADDIQTYTLPHDAEGRAALARAMGFGLERDFQAELRARRMAIRGMYNSLLGTEEDAHAEALGLIEGDAGEDEIRGYLALKGLRSPERAVKSLVRVREEAALPRPPHERALMRRVLPPLIDLALNSEGPDRALSGLEGLMTKVGLDEARLTAFMDRRELAAGTVRLFALAPELTRAFLSGTYYLDRLIEEMPIRKSLRKMAAELGVLSEREGDLPASLARFRNAEDLRLGMFFLSKVMRAEDLMRQLSHAAEAAVSRAVLAAGGGEGFLAVGMGKLGGREMAYGSDLDLIFVSGREDGPQTAEKTIKSLTSYTAFGPAYEVDSRLRPDGTKGTITKELGGLRDYYMQAARGWEVQALLRARPVGGDAALARAFMDMAGDVIRERGKSVRRREIEEMRGRIVRELARDAEGLDIKLGPGGIEDMEFHVQWLQLKASAKSPGVLVQGTLPALRRLEHGGFISRRKRAALSGAYTYYRALAAVLRLNGLDVVEAEGEAVPPVAAFMGEKGPEGLVAKVRALREKVLALTRKA